MSLTAYPLSPRRAQLRFLEQELWNICGLCTAPCLRLLARQRDDLFHLGTKQHRREHLLRVCQSAKDASLQEDLAN
ncbi:hypothetical protein AAC387_Pa02g2517 [Persea americana]